jgi:hypothetical protein
MNGRPILEIIEQTVRWTLASKTPLSFSAGMDDCRMLVSVEDLDTVDKRLARVLDRLTLNGQGDTGSSVRQTCKLWADPDPLIISQAEHGNFQFYIAAIHAVTEITNSGQARLIATVWPVRAFEDGTTYSDGASTLFSNALCLNVLEKSYPGCGLRLANAISLGMTPNDIASHAFVKTPVEPEMALPPLQHADDAQDDYGL